MVTGMERISNRVMNLGDLVTEAARRYPARPGFVWGDQTWSWVEINARVDGAANSLLKLGVSRGDRVVVHSRNSNEMFETMFAVFKIGAIWVPTNFRILPQDVGHIARTAGATALIYDSDFPEHADAAREAGVELVISFGQPRQGEHNYADLVRAGHGARLKAAAMERDDPCWFFFTSGTTGRPKAGVLTHGQMAFVINNHLCDLMPDTRTTDASLVVAPLSHGAGIHQLIQVARGVQTILPRSNSLDPNEVFELIERHNVTNVFTVPSILHALTSSPACDAYDHSSLKYVVYAGAPMLRAHQKLALSKLGLCLVQYFGLGEVTGNITVLPPHLHNIEDSDTAKIGTCGMSRTCMQIDIQDGEGRSLKPFETGEICVIGPAVFNGYFNNDVANADAFRNGWFRTGDIGYLDDEGYLFITGRASDMFISGGSNIYPLEIEEKIAAHPAIKEVCVVGLPDEKWGEAGAAAIVLESDASISADELRAYLDGKLASYKIPKRFEFVTDLPRSGYGKVTKALVKELLQGNDPSSSKVPGETA